MEEKYGNLSGKLLSMNNMEEVVENIGSIKAKFVIHSLNDYSQNNQKISELTGYKYCKTLVNQPVVAKYYPESYVGSRDDAFGSHEVVIDRYRGTGEEFIACNTQALGVFTDVSIEDIDGVKCLCGEAVLWADRYPNSIGLLMEWMDRGVNIATSCEYLYSEYIVHGDGKTECLNPTYTGLCILNSEDRGEHKVVEPAYKCSKLLSLNEAIRVDIENNTEQEEGETKVENENIITEEAIEETVEETVEEVAQEEVIEEEVAEVAGEEENAETEAVEEVEQVETVVEVAEKQEEEILTSENAKLKEELVSEKEEKLALVQEIASLKKQIEDLIPFKEKVQEMEYNEKLQETVAQYKEKFTTLNALDKFETEEVQALVKETLDAEKSVNAKLSLADMLVDLATNSVVKEEKTNDTMIKEACSKKVKSLVPTSKSSTEYCGINLG